MLNYTNLFDELRALYEEGGRDPESFQGLARALARTDAGLSEYCRELTRDYVERLAQRLARGDEGLGPEDRALVRSWVVPDVPDPEQHESALLDSMQELDQSVHALFELRELPLNLNNLERLRRLVLDCRRRLPGIRQALEERTRVREAEMLLERLDDPQHRDSLLALLRERMLDELDEEPARGEER